MSCPRATTRTWSSAPSGQRAPGEKAPEVHPRKATAFSHRSPQVGEAPAPAWVSPAGGLLLHTTVLCPGRPSTPSSEAQAATRNPLGRDVRPCSPSVVGGRGSFSPLEPAPGPEPPSVCFTLTATPMVPHLTHCAGQGPRAVPIPGHPHLHASAHPSSLTPRPLRSQPSASPSCLGSSWEHVLGHTLSQPPGILAQHGDGVPSPSAMETRALGTPACARSKMSGHSTSLLLLISRNRTPLR